VYDVLVRNGRISDGTGNPWFSADIGIKGDRIARIGPVEPAAVAREVIDAAGKVVAPGFIDIHTHSDYSVFAHPTCDSKILQGVTTVVSGNCGGSAAPVSAPSRHLKPANGLDGDLAEVFTWTDIQGYLDTFDGYHASCNMATYVGLGSVRETVMGVENRVPSPGEIRAMQALLRESLEQGAVGFSTGLVYVPGCYATLDELLEVSRAAMGIPGIHYVSHTRSLNERLYEGIDEAIAVGETTGLPVQLSHMCPAPPYWHKAGEMLAKIDGIRHRGVEVTMDMFPYSFGGNSLFNQVPPWAREGGAEKLVERLKDPATRQAIKEDTLKHGSASGGSSKRVLIKEGRWDLIWLGSAQVNRQYIGLTIEEIAKILKKDPYETMLDLTIEEGPHTSIMGGDRTEEDVAAVLAHPLSMVGSDGSVDSTAGDASRGIHPRSYGTFARVLSRYVRERRVLTLEQAIRKMSSMPAQKIGFLDRGLLRVGMMADIAVFDTETIADNATIKEPRAYATGVSEVLVNGEVVVRGGRHTGARPGRALRRRA
jgi:N-acyl-D-amino-acid deacylase